LQTADAMTSLLTSSVTSATDLERRSSWQRSPGAVWRRRRRWSLAGCRPWPTDGDVSPASAYSTSCDAPSCDRHPAEHTPRAAGALKHAVHV